MPQTKNFEKRTYIVPAYYYIVTIDVKFEDNSQMNIKGNFEKYNGLTTREIINVIQEKTQKKIDRIDFTLSVGYCISDTDEFIYTVSLVTIINLLPKDESINNELLKPLVDSYIRLRLNDIGSKSKMPVNKTNKTVEFTLPQTSVVEAVANELVKERNSTPLRAIRSFLEKYICFSKDIVRDEIERKKAGK